LTYLWHLVYNISLKLRKIAFRMYDCLVIALVVIVVRHSKWIEN
jgi:hypothetical protein